MDLSIVLKSFGPAIDALEVMASEVHSPSSDEVRLEMLAAPINPADINIVEGKYGELPELPAVIGNEGCGRVVELGDAVTGLAPGDLVVVLRRGTWSRSVTLPASDVVKVPAGVDPIQASMLGVNPPTALLMLESFTQLSPGEWIVQNAANSAVGRSVIQIARARGWRTLNVVRRPELVEELMALGGDVVVTEEVDLRKQIRDFTGGSKARLGLNAVGGSSALNVANALAKSSPLVTYGAMSKQSLKLPNGMLIFSDLRFVGFWLTRWKAQASAQEVVQVFHELGELVSNGKLKIAVDSIYGPQDIQPAIAAAGEGGRNGKVVLSFEPREGAK